MAGLAAILKKLAVATPVLLLTVIIDRETTARTEMEGLVAEGMVMAVACVFWCPSARERRLSPGMRKRRW